MRPELPRTRSEPRLPDLQGSTMFSRASVVGLSACAVQPQWYDYIGREVGAWACYKAGGLGLHAHCWRRKAPALARPGRSGRGVVCRAGRSCARPLAGVKGIKVTGWSPETGTAIRDLRTRTGVGLSVGAIWVSVNSVLPLRTREYSLQSL